jgi:lipopolysaccharide transport system ATP-binding protein
MTQPVISVRGLSKKYKLGATLSHDTLRDQLTQSFKSLWQSTHKAPRTRDQGQKQNNEIWALKDISFDVNQGEVVGIIGRNGAGKSTLLKILSQITEPTTGEVRVRGRVASLLEVGTGFHGELTGRENIYLNGAILGMKKKEIDAKFDEIVAFAEIEKFIDTPVKRYSSGMYMRLAFAVAAHLETEILLVDEVLAVGDTMFQNKCIGRMGNVAKEGRTVLFVSHNMSAILNLCSWGLLLHEGRSIHRGDIATVVKKYMRFDESKMAGLVDLSRHPGRMAGMVPIAKSIGLRLSDPLREFTSFVCTGEDLLFEIQYDCNDQSIELIQIGVSSITGQRIFTVGTNHSPGFSHILKGKGKIECYLPKVMLAEGEYSVSVMIGKLSPPYNLDVVNNAMRFHVQFNNYFGTGWQPIPNQGNLIQNSEWHVISE